MAQRAPGITGRSSKKRRRNGGGAGGLRYAAINESKGVRPALWRIEPREAGLARGGLARDACTHKAQKTRSPQPPRMGR
ncbi:hypothetical protein GCM10027276_19380 [Comamonas piscis]